MKPPTPAVTPPAKTRSHTLAGEGTRVAVLTGIAYALLLLIIWGAHNIYSGLPYETAFPLNSETGPVLSGFFYSDFLRMYTSTFYHLSYLLSRALGMTGSYVPYQVVYALLWWGRAFLVFVLARRFFPRCVPVCYAAGALALVQSSDGSLQWVGQMNQFGFIFWMLLGFYFLTRAADAPGLRAAALLTLAAGFFAQMSLWSYESPLVLICAFPVALLISRGFSRRKLLIAAAWYCVPALYLFLTLRKYTQSVGASYQEGVMRKSWALKTILDDWFFNTLASVKFWAWPRSPIESSDQWLAAAAVAVFLAAGVAVIRFAPRESRTPQPRVSATMLAAGLTGVVLSFPVYLLLESARGLWRTQLLSGPGAGLFLAGLAALLSLAAPRRFRAGVAISLALPVIFCGSAAALELSKVHLAIWERHRAAVAGILQQAPSVQPDSVILLDGVDKNADPFGDNLWFYWALRLAYPGVPVSGMYLYADHTPPPGANLKADGDRWKWDGTGMPPEVRDAPIANTIVIHRDPSGNETVAAAMSPALCRGTCVVDSYHPATRITGPVSPIAARRFRLGK